MTSAYPRSHYSRKVIQQARYRLTPHDTGWFSLPMELRNFWKLFSIPASSSARWTETLHGRFSKTKATSGKLYTYPLRRTWKTILAYKRNSSFNFKTCVLRRHQPFSSARYSQRRRFLTSPSSHVVLEPYKKIFIVQLTDEWLIRWYFNGHMTCLAGGRHRRYEFLFRQRQSSISAHLMKNKEQSTLSKITRIQTCWSNSDQNLHSVFWNVRNSLTYELTIHDLKVSVSSAKNKPYSHGMDIIAETIISPHGTSLVRRNSGYYLCGKHRPDGVFIAWVTMSSNPARIYKSNLGI